MATKKALPSGSFPTMITPFVVTEDAAESGKKIDYEAVDRLVEWYIASGCAGIFSPCLSSEMYDLSQQESAELAKHVHSKTNGRCAVVSTGTHNGENATIKDQAAFTREMAKHCDAAVVITCHLDPQNEGDEVWKKNCEEFLALTPGILLGLYECPVPYKRVLSPELLAWAASTGRFLFHKDTCCDRAQIKAKLEAVQQLGDAGSSFRFFNANVETLEFSTMLGGAGFSGISANFYPHLHAWMVKAMQAPGYSEDKALQAQVQEVQDFFSLAELTVCINYPASAKHYLATRYPSSSKPLMAPYCRKFQRLHGAQPVFSEQDNIRFAAMHRAQRALSKRLGIEEQVP